MTDITCITTKQEWLYVAAILDLYSRMIVGWSMPSNRHENLAERALDQPLAHCRPQADLLYRSDRGSQYTSRAYPACLERYGIQPSMSRKGNGWNNAAMESSFGTLKEECAGEIIYSSYDEARLALFTNTEVYYNRVRRHSILGYVSPYNYERMENQPM